MQLENLFPTPIGFFNYEDGLTAEEKKYLVDQEQRPNEGNTSSVNKYVLKSKELANLTTYIEKCAHQYFMATICPKYDVNLSITQSWVNWTKPGQFHHKHSHHNSLISGCFYVNANKETDKIFFYKDKYKFLDFPPADWNAYNSDSWWYSVGENMLIFFPSGLTHMVQPVGGEETRISLAFNLFPVGYVGEEDALTALYVK